MRHPIPGAARKSCAIVLAGGLLAALASPSPAQEAKKGEKAPAAQRQAPKAEKRAKTREKAEPLHVFRVGMVHPVSGDPIQDGAIVIRGQRIVSVGPFADAKIPEGAQVHHHPEAHAYPGLVDAMSTAFVDRGALTDRGVNAGTPIVEGLDPFAEGAPTHLIRHGVTTAYVANQSSAAWRGMGAVIRLSETAAQAFENKGHASVSLRMTAGPGDSHPLSRVGLSKSASSAFKALEAYEKQWKDHEKAMKKYEKDFKAWLDHYKKDKDGEESKPSEGNSGRGRPSGRSGDGSGRRTPGGRRGGRRSGGGDFATLPEASTEPQDPKPAESKKQDPKPAAKKQDPKSDGKNQPPSEGKAPTRPKYPKQPKKDPAKDALLKVLNEKLPLRVEAHRVDEIRAALKLAKEHDIARLVLEQATAGDRVAEEIARAGAPVVVTNVLPGTANKNYAPMDDPVVAESALPARLHDAGVAVAIGSGSAQAGRHLTAIAAWCAGHGMPESAALRAITLTPAEILGVAKDVGSLDAGKLADLVITSGPLFQSDCRVLRVVSAGQTAYEAK